VEHHPRLRQRRRIRPEDTAVEAQRLAGRRGGDHEQQQQRERRDAFRD
jgi:hypothetical protein